MVLNNRLSLAFVTWMATMWVLVAGPSDALAQEFECRATETQPECHERLQCETGEPLQDCQDRLRQESDWGGSSDQPDGARGTDSRGDSRHRSDDGARGTDSRDDGAARGDSGRDRGSRDAARQERDGGRDGGDRSRGRSDQRGGDGARQSRSQASGGSDFVANKTFGLGLEVGAPSGLSGKYFLSDSGALNFGAGGIYRHYYYDRGLHVYLDYLWHPVSLASTSSLELPLYIGLGGRFWDFEHCRLPNRRDCHSGSALGVRVPFGIAFDFNRAPLDIFVQAVPVLDILSASYYREFHDRRGHFGVDGSVGIRYWFN